MKIIFYTFLCTISFNIYTSSAIQNEIVFEEKKLSYLEERKPTKTINNSTFFNTHTEKKDSQSKQSVQFNKKNPPTYTEHFRNNLFGCYLNKTANNQSNNYNPLTSSWTILTNPPSYQETVQQSCLPKTNNQSTNQTISIEEKKSQDRNLHQELLDSSKSNSVIKCKPLDPESLRNCILLLRKVDPEHYPESTTSQKTYSDKK